MPLRADSVYEERSDVLLGGLILAGSPRTDLSSMVGDRLLSTGQKKAREHKQVKNL